MTHLFIIYHMKATEIFNNITFNLLKYLFILIILFIKYKTLLIILEYTLLIDNII